jgi:hypothetical protein
MESFQTTGKCLVSAFLRKLSEKVEQFDITGPTTKKSSVCSTQAVTGFATFLLFHRSGHWPLRQLSNRVAALIASHARVVHGDTVRHKSESCWPHLKTRTTFWGWGGHLTSSK